MKKRIISYLLGLGVILLVFAANVWACQCDGTPNPPCRAYGDTPVIFTGIVLESDPFDPQFQNPSRKAKLKVEKTIKGIDVKEITIFSDPRCGPFFEEGKQYLVYAYGPLAHLETNMCTRTRLLKDTTEDFEYFEKLPTLKDGGLIFGTVKKYANGYGNDEDFGLTKPVPNIVVRIRGDKHRTYLSRTDRNGSFKISNVPAGRYLVDAILPKNLNFSANTGSRPLDFFELKDKGCAEIKYYVDFEGEISGKILDANGKGVAGLDVQLVSADYKYEGQNDTGPLLGWTLSRNDGSYRLDGIPPGRYRLGIGIGGAFDSFGKNGQIFYPNTTDPQKATIVTLVESKKLRNVNMPVPKKP